MLNSIKSFQKYKSSQLITLHLFISHLVSKSVFNYFYYKNVSRQNKHKRRKMRQKENEDNKTRWGQHFDSYIVRSLLEEGGYQFGSKHSSREKYNLYNVYKIHNLKTNQLLRSLTIPGTENARAKSPRPSMAFSQETNGTCCRPTLQQSSADANSEITESHQVLCSRHSANSPKWVLLVSFHR